MMGQFISIEGIEGAGKTTAMNVIRRCLEEKNIPAYFTREPGGTPFAEQMRALLLQPEKNETIQAETELLLMFAGRAQHLATCIKPYLMDGTWVVSDRFIDASYAYQAAGRALPIEFVRTLDELIVNDWYPTLTILLDIEPQLGLSRAAKRGVVDRIEREHVTFFERVREAYLLRQRENPDRIKLIDGSQSVDDVQRQIEAVLTTFISSLA